jgi:excisionase family DNA binding protein
MTNISINDIEFLTSAEVAEKLKLNQQVVVRKLQTGEIPGYKIGKDWRVAENQLMEWLETHSNRSRLSPRAKIEKAFFKDGHLTEIPAQRKKRVVVLERLLNEFELARVYTESEINTTLRRFHDDVCTLRREFIMEKMMVRSKGKYCRVSSYRRRAMTTAESIIRH